MCLSHFLCLVWLPYFHIDSILRISSNSCTTWWFSRLILEPQPHHGWRIWRYRLRNRLEGLWGFFPRGFFMVFQHVCHVLLCKHGSSHPLAQLFLPFSNYVGELAGIITVSFTPFLYSIQNTTIFYNISSFIQ